MGLAYGGTETASRQGLGAGGAMSLVMFDQRRLD